MTRRSLLGLLPFVPVAARLAVSSPPRSDDDGFTQLTIITDRDPDWAPALRCNGKFDTLAADLAELIASYRRTAQVLPAELRAFADSMRL